MTCRQKKTREKSYKAGAGSGRLGFRAGGRQILLGNKVKVREGKGKKQ